MLLGIGNELNGDDGVGNYVAKRFRKKGWQAIDCSTVPENYIGTVRKALPELLVIVDAACMNLPSGSTRRLKKRHMGSAFMSTHALPLKEFISEIEKYAKEVVLIGIQPEQTERPDELSEKVKDAADKVMEIIKRNKLHEIEELE